jgi:hypothetical protein
MDIKINKGISIIISVIWILVSMFSLLLVYGFFYWTYKGNVNEIKWNWLILLNFGFIIESLTSLLIGIWLYINADKLNQDKWTWMLMGFIYGQYSLILLMLVIIMQNIYSKIDLLKAVQNLFILIVISYLFNMLSKYLITPNVSKILDMENGSYIIAYTKILDSIPSLIMLIMNVILAFKFKSWIINFSLLHKILWIVAVLISGLFPIILYDGLNIIRRENINAA